MNWKDLFKVKENSDLQISRYERKFAVPNFSRAEARQIILHNPARFTEIFSQRYVNNIYLDTPGFTFYNDNIIGKNSRKKIRIRWYGELFGDVQKPVLEYKLKSGLSGKKGSYKLKGFKFDKTFDLSVLRKIFDQSDLPDWVRHDLAFVEPGLVNRYSRHYFLSFDQKFRLTLDDELSYYEVSRRNNTFSRRVNDDSSVIIELKYNLNNDHMAGTIANHFPFRMTKSSKYVNGIEHFRFNVAI
jgi:hypothetical protein